MLWSIDEDESSTSASRPRVQMSNDVYEDIKVKKFKLVPQPDGADLVLFDFSYTLLTRAGFTVNRRGVASALLASDALVRMLRAA